MASVDVSSVVEKAGHLPVHSKGPLKVQHNNYETFHENLATLWREGAFTDVVLRSGYDFPCHKVVLSAASQFFRNKFRVSPECKVLSVENISQDILKAVVKYLYTGHLEVAADQVKSLAEACVEFQLPKLKDECDIYLSQNIVLENVMGFYEFGRKTDLMKTKQEAKKIFLKRAEKFGPSNLTSEYRALSEESFVELLSSDDLLVHDESTVFNLVENWVKASHLRSNDSCVSRVLTHVRLPLCAVDYLINTVEKSPLLRGPKARAILNKAKNDKLQNIRIKSRKKPTETYVLIGGLNEKLNKQCWKMSNGSGQWDEFTTLPNSGTCLMGVCIFADTIVITGGVDKNFSTYNDVWQFSIRGNKWSALPHMLEKRAGHGMCVAGGYVYVMGGECGDSQVRSMERLRMGQPKWEACTPMFQATAVSGAITMNNHIYVFGLDSVSTQAYSLKGHIWKKKADMPETFEGSVVTDGENMYAVGGGLCMRYHPALDFWVVLAKPPVIQLSPVAVYLKYERKIIVSSGTMKISNDDGTEVTDDMLEYIQDRNEWTFSQLSLPAPMFVHGMLTTSIEWE